MAHSGQDHGGSLQAGSDDGGRTQSSQHCSGLYNGQEDGLHFIAQEVVQGKDLATIMKGTGKPDIASALHVIGRLPRR